MPIPFANHSVYMRIENDIASETCASIFSIFINKNIFAFVVVAVVVFNRIFNRRKKHRIVLSTRPLHIVVVFVDVSAADADVVVLFNGLLNAMCSVQ